VWGGTLGGKRGQGHEVRGAAEKFEPRILDYFASKGMRIQQIACGQNHSMALTAKGQVYTWGEQQYYQCGHGSKSNEDIEEP
jgi:alpha-tubulin suppressor-like RCC1 family protein